MENTDKHHREFCRRPLEKYSICHTFICYAFKKIIPLVIHFLFTVLRWCASDFAFFFTLLVIIPSLDLSFTRENHYPNLTFMRYCQAPILKIILLCFTNLTNTVMICLSEMFLLYIRGIHWFLGCNSNCHDDTKKQYITAQRS